MSEDLKVDERIPIAFQVACDVCDFNCVPGDNCEKKHLYVDETTLSTEITDTSSTTKASTAPEPTTLQPLPVPDAATTNSSDITNDTNSFNDCISSTKDSFDSHLVVEQISKDPLLGNHLSLSDSGIVGFDNELMEEARDQDGSETSSSSHESSAASDDSVNPSTTQTVQQSSLLDHDGAHTASLLEASLNSSSDYYYSTHDSAINLFSPRSNKRSSSSIGLDDEMDIDQLTELSSTHPSSGVGPNVNQYKKLRKREIID